jgi:hypothetical protein
VATKEEEQAVSVEMQGPWSPKVKDTLPTMKGKVLPVLAAADLLDIPCSDRCSIQHYSVQSQMLSGPKMWHGLREVALTNPSRKAARGW